MFTSVDEWLNFIFTVYTRQRFILLFFIEQHDHIYYVFIAKILSTLSILRVQTLNESTLLYIPSRSRICMIILWLSWYEYSIRIAEKVVRIHRWYYWNFPGISQRTYSDLSDFQIIRKQRFFSLFRLRFARIPRTNKKKLYLLL